MCCRVVTNMKTLGKTIFVISSLLISLFNSPVSRAATVELHGEIFRIIPYQGDAYVSIDTRRKYLIALANYLHNFSNRVPRISPVEREWLETEMDASLDRLYSVTVTREFALHQLGGLLDTCLVNTGMISTSQSNSAYAQFEMYHWTEMVSCFVELTDDLTRSYLTTAELTENARDDTFAMGGLGLIVTILLNKVLPSAMIDTMEWSTMVK